MNDNKLTALVTGAASGIGLAIAERLAADGYAVMLLDVDPRVDESARKIAQEGRTADGFVLDVADGAAVEAVMRDIVQSRGNPAVLVNNAGLHPIPRSGSLRIEDTSLEEWNRTLDVNLTGAFLMCRAVMPHMRAAGKGRIINIASRAGRTAVTASGVHYAASKAGMIGLTRAVAAQCAKAGITVNAIAPGRIATPLTERASDEQSLAALKRIPVGRAGTAEEIAAIVAFMASDAAAFITGAVLDANGGAFMG